MLQKKDNYDAKPFPGRADTGGFHFEISDTAIPEPEICKAVN